MNSRATWRIFLTAVGLFLFIYFFESRQPDSVERRNARERLFPNLDVAAVNSLELRLTNQVIRAEKTNGVWRLLTPPYPAQNTPIETFVEILGGLERREVIPASQIPATNGLRDFGLEPPIASVIVGEGTNRFHLYVGGRTPLADQIYAQTAGSGEVIITDTRLLKALPSSVNDWRSPMLLTLLGRDFDRIQIRSGPRLLEFERDPALQLWRISKPIAARANNDRINDLLQTLATARVSEFVTDSPTADLERFGLQAPEIELSLLLGTNRVTGLEFGASPTNDPAQVYARRLATTNIVLTARSVTEPLLLPYKTFHDQRLLSTPAREIAQITAQHPAGGFTIDKQTNGLWVITLPAPMAADQNLVKFFLTNLLRMEIVDFAKDVPNEADLKQFGLDAPSFSVGIFVSRANGMGGFTNALATQLNFGAHQPNGSIFARRSDEIPVYLTHYGEALELPRHAWQLRDRRVFDFAPTNATALVISLGGQTNRLARNVAHGWTTDSIQNAAVEEAVFRLGLLHAVSWVDKGTQRMRSLGFQPDGLTVAAEVTRNGVAVPAALIFGRRSARGHYYAATIFPGETEPTVFEFPLALYEDLARALNLPNPQ